MAKGKYAAKHAGRVNMKPLALIMALVLTLGGVIGGTVAWLIATPDPVVNTFTYGDINIDLDETDTKLDDDNDPNTNEYEMMPGQSITMQRYLYHSFWGDGGTAIVGEVSMVNDDANDNRFYEPCGRFSAIEEDEAPEYLLCNEYPAAE